MDTGLVHHVVYLFTPQSPAFAGTHFAYPQKDDQARVGWLVAGAPSCFTPPKVVTHPGTNPARRSATSLITSNALKVPLSETATTQSLDPDVPSTRPLTRPE